MYYERYVLENIIQVYQNKFYNLKTETAKFIKILINLQNICE